MTADAVVIGAGPAGLMAAEVLASTGLSVLVAEQKPSPARKLLMAGKSGLNLTMNQPGPDFAGRYPEGRALIAPALAEFGPREVMTWAEGLGQELFTGSTGRVFPVAMKASPLLRAWLSRLQSAGLDMRTRWHWTGWDGPTLLFDTPEGPERLTPQVTILALGGGSWARLGSDGLWAGILGRDGQALVPFTASNAALAVDWTAHMAPHFGCPVKGVALRCGEAVSRGEMVVSAKGLEGGGLYALGPALRSAAPLFIDLAPDTDPAALARRIEAAGAKQSLSNTLRKAGGLSPVKRALLQEFTRPVPRDPLGLTGAIKRLRVHHAGFRPIDEAISTAGGLSADAVTETLMLRSRPGTFAAGEMLDWDAPTGGYLLTACLATGAWAGRHAARWLVDQSAKAR